MRGLGGKCTDFRPRRHATEPSQHCSGGGDAASLLKGYKGEPKTWDRARAAKEEAAAGQGGAAKSTPPLPRELVGFPRLLVVTHAGQPSSITVGNSALATRQVVPAESPRWCAKQCQFSH